LNGAAATRGRIGGTALGRAVRASSTRISVGASGSRDGTFRAYGPDLRAGKVRTV
jgi:hypothetical protein